MPAVDQVERLKLRESDSCIVLTLREATALPDELIGLWTLAELVSATLSQGDLSRGFRVLCNQIDTLNGDVEHD